MIYYDTIDKIKGVLYIMDKMGSIININDFNPSNTIFFSVDINNGFCKSGALFSERTKRLIPKTEVLFHNVLEKGFQSIAFTDEHPDNSPEFSGYPVHCLKNTEESLLVDELSFLYSHQNSNVIPKNSTNGFFLLNNEVLGDKFLNYIITGCCTDICVHQLAVTLKTWFNQNNLQKRVIVIKSLVDTFDLPNHNADEYNQIFFNSMMSNGVEVVNDIIL